MKKNEELIVITKTYDLIVWTVNHTSRFPRNHRHVLGERIEQQLYDVLELLIEAKFSRQRRAQRIRTRLVSWLGHARPGSALVWREALFATIRFQKGEDR